MKLAPELRTNRLGGERTVLEILASHRHFLSLAGVDLSSLARSEPDDIQVEIQRDLHTQISHNVAAGLLLPSDEGTVRYSWRGLLFIWVQFLRDFVRLS